MEWIQNIEKFFIKVENFFSKGKFIARMTTAASVGMAAFNDKLMNRNEQALKTYLDSRKDATPAGTETE